MYDRCRERPPFPRLNRRHYLAQGLKFGNFGGGASTLKYVDSSLYGKHGTLTGMDPVTDWVWDSKLNRFALDFDGDDDEVHIQLPSIQYASPFTLSFWLKGTATTTNKGVLNWRTDVQLLHLSARTLYNGLFISRKKDASLSSLCNSDQSGNIAAGAHVCITCAGGDVRPGIHVNGEDVQTDGSALMSDTGDADTLSLGEGNTYIGRFVCRISDVIVHDHVLNQPLIRQLADPSNVMLSGLILPPRRRLWAVSGGEVPASYLLMLWAANKRGGKNAMATIGKQ